MGLLRAARPWWCRCNEDSVRADLAGEVSEWGGIYEARRDGFWLD